MKASVYLRYYKTKKGERRFYLDVREYGRRGRTVQLGPISKKLAEERRLQVLHELFLGTHRQEPLVHLFLSEFVEKFFSDFANGSRSPGSIENYRACLMPLVRRLHGYRLNQVRRHDIEKYFSSWIVSGRTKNILLSTLRLLFSKAVEWQYLASSPVEGMRRFPEASQGSRALTPNELTTLWDGLTKWQRSIIVVMINSGLRPGEVVNLKFQDIDLEGGRLGVVNDKDRKTKSRKTRFIPLNEDLKKELEFLRAYLPVQGRPRRNHHQGCEVVPRAIHQQQYVFCHEDSSKVRSIRAPITRALKNRGLVGVTPHGLRKTFCSQLARAKIHPKVAQTFLGHADVSLTMKIYTEIDDEQLRSAVNSLSQVQGMRSMDSDSSFIN